MGFWGRLFGSPDVVDKATDAIINTGDALFFTDEERSQANLAKLNWVLEFHKVSSGSNLARRLLAVMFSGVFLTLTIVTAALYGFGLDLAGGKVFTILNEVLVTPMGMIVAFYFLSGMTRDYTERKK